MKSEPDFNKKVLMLLSNPFSPDLRVLKEAQSLDKFGCRVIILCWDRDGTHKPKENFGNIEVRRILLLTRRRLGLRQLFFMPRFWIQCILKSMTIKADVVHAHDLDTLFPAIVIKYLKGISCVYDAHEHFPLMMSYTLPKLAIKLLKFFEKMLARRANYLIAASSYTQRYLEGASKKNVYLVPNYAVLSGFEDVSESEIYWEKRCLGLDEKDFIVSYIGSLSENRDVLPLLECSHIISGDLKIIIVGDGSLAAHVKNIANKSNKILYVGWLPLEKVPLYTKLSDVVYYALKDYSLAVYNNPNAFFNALAAGKPVVVSNVGDIGEIVRAEGCGIAIDKISSKSISEAIKKLMARDIYQSLSIKAILAAKRKYNWKVAEKQLKEIYFPDQ